MLDLEYICDKMKQYLPPLKESFYKMRRIAVEEVCTPFTFRDGNLVVLVSNLWEN